MLDSIFLVRHGETAWSKSGQHTGRTDIPLTDQGERDATQLKARLAPLNVDHVFTSPLKRAMRTCELAGFGARAQVMQDLFEWDYGAYEGKTSAQIRIERPDWDLFRDGGPAGESPTDICARADRALTALRGLDGSVMIFSSGHFLRVFATRWLGCEVSYARCLALDPASLSRLGFEHGHQDPVLRLWNDARRN